VVAWNDLVLFAFAGFQIWRLTVFANDGDFSQVFESSLIVGVFFGKVNGAVKTAVLE